MSTIEGKNFANFTNVNLKGQRLTDSALPSGGVLRFDAGSATQGVNSTGGFDSTIAIAPISGSTTGSVNGSVEVPYLSIANAGISVGTGYIRFVPFGGTTSGTISVNTTYNDTDRAWTLPSKSGTFPISGTFAVDLPVVASGGYAQTAVTITGLRVEDGIVVSPQSVAAFGLQSARGALVVTNAVPTANTLTLTFVNVMATATIALTQSVWGYTAVR